MNPWLFGQLVCSCALCWVCASCHQNPSPKGENTEQGNSKSAKDSEDSHSASEEIDSASVSESENGDTGCVPDTTWTDTPGTDTTETSSVDSTSQEEDSVSASDTASTEVETLDTESADTGSSSASNTQSDDTGTVEVCPEAMVPLDDDVCMDRYEASRPDATAIWAGVDESAAHSRAGVLPWYVNPMTSESLSTFTTACESAGKRPCTAEEWSKACAGPSQTTYFFGNMWDPAVCNSVDTYCQECCDILGLGTCPLGENCGYSSSLTSYPYTPETCFVTEPYSASSCHVCFHVMPTGAFPSCTNELGLFDVAGNVWEIVPVPTSVDSRGYQVRGGAFNCGSPSTRFLCSYNATWSALYAGFRCCKDRL